MSGLGKKTVIGMKQHEAEIAKLNAEIERLRSYLEEINRVASEPELAFPELEHGYQYNAAVTGAAKGLSSRALTTKLGLK